jgi:hypothetical protein
MALAIPETVCHTGSVPDQPLRLRIVSDRVTPGPPRRRVVIGADDAGIVTIELTYHHETTCSQARVVLTTATDSDAFDHPLPSGHTVADATCDRIVAELLAEADRRLAHLSSSHGR